MKYIMYTSLELMMISTMIYCIGKMINKKISIKAIDIIFVTFLSFIMVLNNLLIINEIKLLASLVINIIIIKIVFKASTKECIVSTILYFVLEFIIELLLAMIFSLLIINNLKDVNNSYMIKIILSTIECIATICLFKNNKINELIKKINYAFNNKIKILRILAIIAILLNVIAVFLSNDLKDLNIIVLSISSIIFIIVCGYEMINDKYNILILKQLNTNLNSSINAYSETIDSCREFKHNLKNDLFALKSTLSKKEQEKINEIIQKYNNNYNWISNLSEIPEGLQGLIFIKKKEAKEKNIDIVCDIKNKIKIKEQDYFIICEIVGILLDNSIEASVNAKSKSIVINIKEEENKMIIQIINKFKSVLDLSRITEKNYSTKKKKSGIGLNYINKIKKNNINVDYQIINDLFYATVEYSKKVKK